MNIKEIKELIEAVCQHGIAELEIERGGVKVRIRKESNHATTSSVPTLSSDRASAHRLAAAGSAEAGPTPSAPSEASIPAEEEDLYIVRSPIVGTFYRAPNANSEPFVKVSDLVEPGRILCIIEAMKLMNEIEAEVSGEVVKIYVQSGEPVEFGQTLFGIRSHKKA